MKVVLAGAQDKNALETLIWADAPNLLCSYEYLRKQRNKGIHTLKKIHDEGKWQITDSGVFTWKVRFQHLNRVWWHADKFPPRANESYQDVKGLKHLKKLASEGEIWKQAIRDWYSDQQGAEHHWYGEINGISCPYDPDTEWDKLTNWAKDQLRDYKTEYFGWVKNACQYTNAIAELDCEWLIEDEIWEWREEMHEIVSQNSDADIIMTPHLYKTERDIRRIAKMTSYLGCDGADDTHPYWTHLMPTMKELKLRVHGWAVTDNKSVKRLPFFSVDSTTWLGGVRYGTTYHYQGNWNMSTIPYQGKQQARAGFTAVCKDLGLDHQKLMEDDAHTVNRFNAKQWAYYADDMAKDTTRSYWLSDEEVSTEVMRQREETGIAIKKDRRVGLAKIDADSSPALSSGRLCNTCFLNTKCPAYEPNSNCTIDMPLDIGDDPANFMKKMIEIQGQRVMFATFAERMQGGVVDPGLTKEMDLLFKITKTAQEMNNTQTESVTISAKKTNGGAGLISQIFGGYGRGGGGGSKPSQSEKVIDVSPLDDD